MRGTRNGAAIVIVALLGTSVAQAAIPGLLGVRGTLYGAAEEPANGTYSLLFSLYDGAAPGAASIWSETVADVEATTGDFEAVLGSGASPLTAALFVDHAGLWLGVQVVAGPDVPVGGEDELPRFPLTSVAYAFAAQTAVSATSANGLTCAGCVSPSELGFDVATQAELNAAIAGAPTGSPDLQCTACVAVAELDFDVATQAELDAVITPLAGALANLGSQVDDLAADVAAVQGGLSDLEGVVDGLEQGGAVPKPPTCTGPGKALQFDGASWSCIDIGLGASAARGIPRTDRWGYVWDGEPRPPAFHIDAVAGCAAIGARLPTATELWRVSLAQVGDIGTELDTIYLWTTVTDLGDGFLAVWLAGTGFAAGGNATTKRSYRCVWPPPKPAGFEGVACHGPPGAECTKAPAVPLLNVDAWDRYPHLGGLRGAAECALSGGRLPDMRTILQLSGSLANIKSNEVMVGIDGHVNWGTDVALGPNYWSLQEPSSSSNGLSVRCVGYETPVVPYSNPLPAEMGTAFTLSDNSSTFSNLDGPVGTVEEALDSCFAAGGHIPSERQMREAIGAGLSESTGAVATSYMVDGGSGKLYGGTMTWSSTTGVLTSSRELGSVPPSYVVYRCIFFPHDEGYAGPSQCAGGVPCFSIAKGAPKATRTWADAKNRSPATRAKAALGCAALGGRLPAGAELIELIRAGLPNGGGVASPIWLWEPLNTITWTGVETGFTARMGSTQGQSGINSIQIDQFTTVLPYRCVWSNELR